MAKIYVRRQPNGLWRLRGLRLAGKELAAQVVTADVPRENLKREAQAIMEVVSPGRGKTGQA